MASDQTTLDPDRRSVVDPRKRCSRRGWAAAGLTCLALTWALAAGANEVGAFHPAIDSKVFPVPESLVPAIEFWREVFGKYTTTQVVLHDDEHLGIVYGVVDVSDLYDGSLSDLRVARERSERVKAGVRAVEELLNRLANGDSAGADPKELARVAGMFATVPGGAAKYRQAIRRIRGQTGQRDRFAEAIEISGMFMGELERIMAAHGAPIELSRLPFIESMFNYRARSKVGASGAWQFTRGASVGLLRIDSAVDERSDVLLAADGAARKLVREYDSLRTWPITITGYNHGANGMARAIRQVGSRDIGRIVREYNSRTFGFASRNFYAEFLAAVALYADRETVFPGVTPRAPLRFDEFPAQSYFLLTDLAKLSGIPIDELAELNPALAEETVRGQLMVPAGYRLRVPRGSLARFQTAWADLPADRKLDRQLATRYRVQSGDTLSTIAQRFGTTVVALQRANQLSRPDRIHIGQVLEIPDGRGGRLPPLQVAQAGSAPAAVADATNGDGDTGEHVVRAGESLWTVAQRFGVTVSALASANGLSARDHLRIGQRLRVPAPGAGRASAEHRVRAGDTLSRIAGTYGVTVRSIMDANRLTTTVIHVGQTLRIPAES
ncbi:MAG TPA: LysM peptidoglycan-binding domain-containing protein [Thermoanaerobaculia bacterium]|nr:LysM peptidoglycan-binding domain-containing protein [Thermoanaerobaculia bacterium]